MKTVVLALLLATGLAGCSTAKRLGMRTSAVPVYMVMGGQLLTGEAQGFADRRASIALQTAVAPSASSAPSADGLPPPAAAAPPAMPATPPLHCAGLLTFTAERSGVVELSCSNGREARLTFQSTDWATGFGYNLPETEAASLTYGLVPEQAAAYLRAPGGKRLAVASGGLTLEPAQ